MKKLLLLALIAISLPLLAVGDSEKLADRGRFFTSVGVGTTTPDGALDVSGDSVFLHAGTAAEADSAFANSQCSFSLDETNDEIDFKCKESGGTTWSRTLGATGGGLTDVVDDTTPQLGGNLDVNGNSIVSVSAGDINITPDTTGDVVIDGLAHPQADGSAGQVLVTDGAGQLSFADQSGALKSAAAMIDNTGTPTVNEEYGGDWISTITDNGTGNMTINFDGSYFSSKPVCVCTAQGNDNICRVGTQATTSAINILTEVSTSGSPIDAQLTIICRGPG